MASLVEQMQRLVLEIYLVSQGLHAEKDRKTLVLWLLVTKLWHNLAMEWKEG